MPYRNAESETTPTPGTKAILAARYRPRSRFSTLARTLVPTWAILAALIWFWRASIGSPDELSTPSFVVLAMLCCGTWLVYRGLHLRRGLTELNQTATLARNGSQAATIELCERMLDRYASHGSVQAVALNNLSIAVYQSGDIERALALLDAIEASGWARPRSALRTLILQNRGVYLALLGDAERAAQCGREARLRMTAATAQASLFVLDALVAARSGKLAEVVALTGTSAASSRLQLRMLRLLRAYALFESVPVSDARDEEIRLLVDGAKPVGAGELYYLVAHWPELERFLSTRGFGAALVRA